MTAYPDHRLTSAIPCWSLLGVLLAGAQMCSAPPPLVTGDVPTADQGTFEWYVGGLHQDSGASITWAAPFSELVYGITKRWEVTAESAFLIKEGEQGVGDTVLGTKYVVLTESEKRPGVALSFEAGLPTGDADRGLGAGAPEYEVRARTQKTFGWFTPIVNVGYTFVEEPTINSVREDRCNTWRASCAQEWRIAEHTKLLTEIYGKTSDEPNGEYRLAANIGFKHNLSDLLQLHGAIGKSLREDNRGGPELRAYLGIRYNFDAPWTRN